MRIEDIPKLQYGDKVLITYKKISEGPLPLPEILREIGFFVDFYGNDTIEISRYDPALIFGKKEDLPERGVNIPDPDNKSVRHSLRNATLGSCYYLLEQTIRLEIL